MFDSIVYKVMLGASLLGAASGFVGTFAVLRRRALVGDMLAHASLPGIGLVFIIWQTRELLPLSLGALATGLLGVACVAGIARWTRTAPDAALGIVLSAFFGAGVLLMTIIQATPEGDKAGLDSYLFGEIASLRSRDVTIIAATGGLLLVFVIALYKELKVSSFDTGFAAAQGWPTYALDLAIMAAIAVVTVIGLPICGVILMAAMLITPAASARFWTNRLTPMLAIASLFGALAGALGCLLAAPGVFKALGIHWLEIGGMVHLPPGPLIVLAGSALLIFSMLAAPEQGIVARWRGRRRMQRMIARDHLLRAMYELSPRPEDARPWIELDKLTNYGGWTDHTVHAKVRDADRADLIERDNDRIRLTPDGYSKAAELVRAHRLWELYMVGDWDRSPERVDHYADDMEHLLPPEVIEELEQKLRAEGRLPSDLPGEVPRSPHVLRSRGGNQ
ncbi:metal ABC transporter permease [Aeoliella mucimassa]|uniref:Manganese transport system membrane protein MntB n=1 Tax=Aeoliella mucimassa TaxID=2527972 RepID=A0A518APZ3_9BACT|nr:iron chelate uptake ABC transporter family permease subunit [Aeoliella mucimassa]QDU56800.1 Manganese transport system membrane protein MntB [Aeoliella mucimassa]